MIINHNMSSAFASRQLSVNEGNLQLSMEKLSSGSKINKAGDDAAGLAISEKMRSQIRGLNQASKNIQNGVSFIQVAEGSLQETTSILQRVRELAVQGANGIYSQEDRMQIQVEVSSLISEVDRIAETAQFNGMNILTGRFAENGLSFHVGANTDQNVKVSIGDMSASALGLISSQNGESEKLSITDTDSANYMIGVIDNALQTVSKQRADLGAYQNRFELAQKGIDISAENLQSAESKIRDTEMASEMVEFTKNKILTEAGVAMLSQANSQNANVLRLFQ